MHPFLRILAATWLMACAAPLFAQTGIDPSGHWEGVIDTPNMPLSVEIDLTKNSKGELVGTIGIPSQRVKGLPLSGVTTEEPSIRFQLGNASGDRAYKGVLSSDGTTMTGDYTQNGFSMPFTLTRKGEARIEPLPRSAPIARELEGTWKGMLEVQGTQMRVVVTMSNHADRTSTATVANLNQGGIDIPVAAITQSGSTLTLDVKAVGGSYVGTLNAEKAELSGTWTQGALTAPLRLRRVAPEQ